MEHSFKSFSDTIIEIFLLLIPLLAGLAVFLFFWGLVKFLTAGGSEENLKTGKQIMLWGIVGIFVMVSIGGIVSLLTTSFGWSLGLPQLPTS